MSNRRFSIKFSGVGPSSLHNGQMEVSYFNVFSRYDADSLGIGTTTETWSGGEVNNYSTIFPTYRDIDGAEDSLPMIQTFRTDSSFGLSTGDGLCALPDGYGNNYSIYRREYEVYERPGQKILGYYYNENFYYDSAHTSEIVPHSGWFYIDNDTGLCYLYNGVNYKMTERVRVFKGQWSPVMVKGNTSSLYDFNITSGRSYQYIMYSPDSLLDVGSSDLGIASQVFANSISTDETTYRVWQPNSTYSGQGKMIKGTQDTSYKYGEPVNVNWDCWTICELQPISYDDNIPIIKGAYCVNLDQVWAFKYSLETGNQTQNISRSDVQTLGQYPKIGFGELNYVSGDVSALLGSEIILYRGHDYIERLRSSRAAPLSTNEKTQMLLQWRSFVNSKNPKLLRDIKGQSWIVQIMGSSNTPKNFYLNQPDTISFQWKQVESTSNVIIYAPISTSESEIEDSGSEEWQPMFKKSNTIV